MSQTHDGLLGTYGSLAVFWRKVGIMDDARPSKRDIIGEVSNGAYELGVSSSQVTFVFVSKNGC